MIQVSLFNTLFHPNWVVPSPCRPVHRRWLDEGLYELRIADVKDEIFDMVKPQDGMRITLKDLVNCKQGGTVCSMLFDVGAFWAHDNRENLPAYQS